MCHHDEEPSSVGSSSESAKPNYHTTDEAQQHVHIDADESLNNEENGESEQDHSGIKETINNNNLNNHRICISHNNNILDTSTLHWLMQSLLCTAMNGRLAMMP